MVFAAQTIAKETRYGENGLTDPGFVLAGDTAGQTGGDAAVPAPLSCEAQQNPAARRARRDLHERYRGFCGGKENKWIWVGMLQAAPWRARRTDRTTMHSLAPRGAGRNCTAGKRPPKVLCPSNQPRQRLEAS